MDKFDASCHNCGELLQISELSCPQCQLQVKGKMHLPRLARLNAIDRQFIELFVLAGGSLKEVGKLLKLSYPTVRNRLDEVIKNLQKLDSRRQQQRLAIVNQLENGELNAAEALKLLNKLEEQ